MLYYLSTIVYGNIAEIFLSLRESIDDGLRLFYFGNFMIPGVSKRYQTYNDLWFCIQMPLQLPTLKYSNI